MKAMMQLYAGYNYWANQLMTEAILQMDEHRHQEWVNSSFPNLYATLLHMWDAESIWWQRLKLHERLVIPSENFKLSTREAIHGLMQQSLQWKTWADQSTEAAFLHQFSYQNTKKEIHKQHAWQVLMHVCNHSTYHRGQLVTMMRQLGVTQIPSTDLIVYGRTVK